MGASRKTLVTGATGYVGQRLARRALARGENVILPVRARDAGHLAERREQLVAALGGADVAERIEVVPCDLSNPAAIAALPKDSTTILHSAAVTRFNVEAEIADRDNRDASLALFELARRSPQLEKLGYISTVYGAGDREGPVPEALLEKPRSFVNHYERSKWETEQALAEKFSDLPWTITRVATVLADDESGRCSQLNAVHNTLKLLYYGLISTVPGDARVPVYLVCGDFVEAGIAAAMASPDKHQVYPVCHQPSESNSLERFIDQAFAAFLEDNSFRKRGIQKPLLVDLVSFELLADGIEGFGGAVLKEALGSMVPFARQLFIHKEFENQRLRSVMPEYQPAALDKVIPNLIQGMIARKWKLA